MTSANPKARTTGPIRPEDLARRYAGRWVICEDVSWEGTSEWVADPRHPDEDERLTALTVERLAEQLEQAAGS